MFPVVNVFTVAAIWILVSKKRTGINTFTCQISAFSSFLTLKTVVSTNITQNPLTTDLVKCDKKKTLKDKSADILLRSTCKL